MLEQIARVMNPLPPARTRKKARLAFVLGFLFSGIALGIYFGNWVDLVVPRRGALATAVWGGYLMRGDGL
jgi:hypothetical protein